MMFNISIFTLFGALLNLNSPILRFLLDGVFRNFFLYLLNAFSIIFGLSVDKTAITKCFDDCSLNPRSPLSSR